MARLADPVKVRNYVYLLGHLDGSDNPFQRITLDANENVVKQEVIGNFELARIALLQTTDGYCT